MSVINRMLRDLDRRAEAPGTPTTRQPSLALMRGTASVTSLPSIKTRPEDRFRTIGVLAALLICLLIAAAWWLAGPIGRAPMPLQGPAARTEAAGPPQTTASQPLPASGLAAVAVLASTDPLFAPGHSATTDPPVSTANARPGVTGAAQAGAQLAALSSLAHASAASVAVAAKAGLAPPDGVRLNPTQRLEAVARPASSVDATSGALSSGGSRVTAPANAPVPVASWQDAAMETVGQAQRLWGAGSREAAVELLKETLVVLERSHAAEFAGAGSVVTLALVREIVRMELAQGQPASVLALLKRHERLLSGQADLWAVRANAAQRIGQHAESSHAYQIALKIRPGEPRWMLGAAVSLAALGQTAAAADLTEQARALDAVSPEVLAYLRQLGVPLRER